MKVWEIKADSLKLMFVQTDTSLNENEFIDSNGSKGVIYNNPNTKNYLARMDNCILRAIDMYYSYCGKPLSNESQKPFVINGSYVNYIISDKDIVRIDVLIKNSLLKQSINFTKVNKNIYLFDEDFTVYKDEVLYIIYYDVNYVERYFSDSTDLNNFDIPEDVQRMIPYFVKAECYEEDEYQMANISRSSYINYLIFVKNKYNKRQTHIKNSNVFNKRN